MSTLALMTKMVSSSDPNLFTLADFPNHTQHGVKRLQQDGSLSGGYLLGSPNINILQTRCKTHFDVIKCCLFSHMHITADPKLDCFKTECVRR